MDDALQEAISKRNNLLLCLQTSRHRYRRVEDVPTTMARSICRPLSELNGMTVENFFLWATTQWDQVPKAYRGEAWIEIDESTDFSTGRVSFFWKEPRPQEEIGADIAEVRARQLTLIASAEALERQQYEALKAKFEGKDSK